MNIKSTSITKFFMTDDLILYHKFTDIESAEEFAKELSDNGIEYLIQDNNHAFVKVVGYNSIDIAIGVNIKAADFAKADQILDGYYNKQILGIDKSYYLFAFTDDELNDIISNPFEWGRLDYQLAKHILETRGVNISESQIEAIKSEKVDEMRKKEKAGAFKIIIGYVLAFVFPVVGIIIGATIKYNRIVLPNGEKFYINTDQDRKHANNIIVIGVMVVCITLLLFLFEKS